MAVHINDINAISVLLDAGARLDIFNKQGYSPLHVAANDNNQGLCDYLLLKGASLESVAPNSPTVLEAAQKGGAFVLADWLQARGARGGLGNSQLLLEYARLRRFDRIQQALENPATQEAAKNTMLFWAVQNGRLDLVKQAIANGADVNAQPQGSRGAVALAAQRAHKPILEVLFQNGAHPNAIGPDGRTALDLAIETRGATRQYSQAGQQKKSDSFLQTIDLLLQAKARPNEETVLLAISFADEPVVERLLKTDISLTNSQLQRQLLQAAAHSGSVAIMQALESGLGFAD